MKALYDGIVNNRMSSDMIMLQVYANYLMNGGSPEGFMDLNDDDVQMMHTVMVAQESKRMKAVSEMFQGMLGVGGN